MRLIIEPTRNNEALSSESRGHKVSIESDYDDLNIDALVGLFRAAAIAYGFSEETVENALGPKD